MEALIEVVDMSCSAGTQQVISGLNFSITQGERVALLGANGAGKSTLINVLSGFVPYGGSVRFAGQELRYHISSARSRMAVVFSCMDDQLLTPSVYEEVRSAIRTAIIDKEAAAKILLDQFGLLGLSSRPVFELSSGEKQKVVLATAMASKPDLLILDEPTKEIDCRTKKRLVEHLNTLTCAVLVATHDYQFAKETCSAAVVLHDGAGNKYPSMRFLSDPSECEAMCLA